MQRMRTEIFVSYPTIDFHRGTQRLAVGTSEGAMIMYDLKTATRLYVLESHSKAVSACGFSPDGRRLVSVSVADSTVSIWKVGASVLGYFQPGVAPRQGAVPAGRPYRSISFACGDPGGAFI